MHTLVFGETRFHFNGDYSGDAIITPVLRPDGKPNDGRRGETVFELQVPCEDLIAFAAEYVRLERIAQLEQAQVHELLGVPKE